MTLREARTAAGLELSDVHEVTKISVRFLRALEAEDWDEIPAPAYVRGFLRTYAEFLNLDPEPLLASLEVAQGTGVGQLREPIIETGELPPARRIRPGRAIAAGLIGLIVVLIALGGDEDDDGGDTADRPGPAEATTEKTTAVPAEPAPAPDRVSLEVRATGEVWVCLVDRRGRALIEGETLTPGDRRGPFESGAFRLTTGNGRVRLSSNDEPLEVPESANPLGFEIRPSGAERLPESERPDCA